MELHETRNNSIRCFVAFERTTYCPRNSRMKSLVGCCRTYVSFWVRVL
uniref:Uncharacterized protein n=1 Tax=Arundo donax TaxID=35708 RepID=A0A0A8YSQ2_ARUDO